MASHKRNDSGIAQLPDALKDISSAHDDTRVQQMRDFIKAANEFTSHDGFEILTNLLKREQDLVAEDERHARIVRRKDQAIDSLETWVEQSRKRIAELEETCKILDDLQASKAETDARVEGLEAALLTKDNTNREQAAEIQTLQEKLETSQFEATSLKEDARKQQLRAEKLERETAQLKDYRTELVPGDDANTVLRLRHLWSMLHKFTKTYISVDLPDIILEDKSAWTELHNLFPKLCLPRTNSQAAKNMRLAAVLHLLAEKIVRYLFDPTYSLAETSGMRDALLRQAETDVQRERACRSVMLSMLQNEHQDMAKDRRNRVHNEVWKVISPFVPNEKVVRDELEKCIQEGQEFWETTKAFSDLHFFNYWPFFSDDQEQLMKFPGDDTSKAQDGASTQRSQIESTVVLTVLPHLYTLDKQVVPGLVVREYQTQIAKAEIESLSTKLLRHTSRSGRPGVGRGRS